MDTFYRRPTLFGAATDDPIAETLIPINDWNSLSKSDRGLLAAYAASLVSDVKNNPLLYANIPTSAPIANRIRQNVSMRMASDRWAIVEGIICDDGEGMDIGKTLLSGKRADTKNW